MKVMRNIVLFISSLVASLIVTAVLIMGSIAATVGMGNPISVPFVVTNEIGEGKTMTSTEFQFPGVLVVVLIIAFIIYLLSTRIGNKRQRRLDAIRQADHDDKGTGSRRSGSVTAEPFS